MKIHNPGVFQGNLHRKRYFEGWYFKQVSGDRNHVYSFIPGVSLAPGSSHSFIQVINGTTGETLYIEYPLKAFSASSSKLDVRVGNSIFTKEFIDLAIDDPAMLVSGRISFEGCTGFPRSISAPSIMGWYAYVPFMECNHGVISVNHKLQGGLSIDGKGVDFTGGKGYVEKDWGTSFPEAWIWVQCNTFAEVNRSFFLSIAKIPWLGNHFTGLICFVYDKGAFHTFATWNGSKIRGVSRGNDTLEIRLENKTHKLEISVAHTKKGDLKAPVQGAMVRMIKESVDAEVTVELSEKSGHVVLIDEGKRAGLEVVDKIFEYLPADS